ncbi:WecB/TagA/CpsF family glycosyltransferase [Phytomonospora sp. NPDC050363]|uniref:WecB/TagA/CpsF family glycosyltransferase n=1 Tax=Phytomonospora sp. NPDC050363 TaxID=3155642 RepID=UPI0033D0445D
MSPQPTFQSRLETRSSHFTVAGIRFDALDEREVVDHVRGALQEGRGGRIVTANVDIVRQALKHPEARAHVEAGTLVVADGAPVVWASKLARRALPARVAGSDLIWSLSGELGQLGGSVFLLGGRPGSELIAARRLAEASPGLRIAGALAPPMGFEKDPEIVRRVCEEVAAANPDMVFVGLGFPKQEWMISKLAPMLPGAWFMGCGASIAFVAGTLRRAPLWMQRSGLEWLHRMAREPRRLFARYVLHDAPLALRLLLLALLRR